MDESKEDIGKGSQVDSSRRVVNRSLVFTAHDGGLVCDFKSREESA